MNRFILATVSLLLCEISIQNLRAESPYAKIDQLRYQRALGKVTLRVVDSFGVPVTNAMLSGAFWPSDSSADAKVFEGYTGTNGLFTAEGETIHSMNYTITKEGYYKTTGKYSFRRQGEDRIRDGRWQPWNPTNTVVLKEHRQPIVMYAKDVDLRIPVRDQAIGFDLEKGDWVAPHGQGATADLVLKYAATYEGPQTFSKRIELSFSNPRDGVQALPLDRTSEFMSVYTAPEEGYARTFIDEQARTRTKILKRSEIAKDQYLVFRVRSVTNEQDRIVSANYGKIYGPNLLDLIIEYGRMENTDRLMFTYYFNPTANDRNIEFDSSRNLFGTTDKRRVYHP